MIMVNPEKEIYQAAVQAFVLTQRRTAEVLVGKERADNLRDIVGNDSTHQETFNRMPSTVLYQDPHEIDGLEAVFTGATVLQVLIQEKPEDTLRVSGFVRKELRDTDFYINISDLSAKQGIMHLEGINQVLAVHDRFVVKMVANLHLIALACRGPLGFGGSRMQKDIVAAGWMSPVFLDQQGGVIYG